MVFNKTTIPGVWLIEPLLHRDERGLFTRTYCEEEFAKHKLNTRWPQSNTSFTRKRGTLRGMHFQAEPKPEIKLVRCTGGRVYDVLVDVRPESPQYGKWEAFELSSENHRILYIPEGIAHGFQALTDDCRVCYHMSENYYRDLARGIRWSDPAIGIEWPVANPVLSKRDQELPLLAQLA